MSEIKEVIGFDLGDGDTAVSKLIMTSDSAPEKLDIYNKKKQVSAICFDLEDNVYIGENAINFEKPEKLYLSFKQKPCPLNYSKLEKLLKDYIRTYYRLLKQSMQIQGGEASLFVIGCPSDWVNDKDNATINAYKELLTINEIPQMKIVSESRAAFINYRDKHWNDQDKIITEMRSNVLVIDIGSSTTDFTLVKGLQQQAEDFGENNLGGSLIDKSIFKLSLAKQRRRQEIQGALNEDRSLEEKCILACRNAKEGYFLQDTDFQNLRVKNCDYLINEENDLYFKPEVTAETIQQVLKEPQVQLDGKSWEEAFAAKIREVKEKLQKENINLSLVLMTGGASRMGFTREICKKEFASSYLYADSEPEHCIADGLARLGRWELLADAFIKEVDKLITDKGVKKIVKNHIPELIGLIAEEVSTGIINDIIKVKLREWQQRKYITFQEIENQIESFINQWLDKEEGTIKTRCENWLKQPEMLEELNQKTKEICHKYKIDESGLNLQTQINPNVRITGRDIPLEGVIGHEAFAELAKDVAGGINAILAIGGALGGWILLFTGHWILAILAFIVGEYAPRQVDEWKQKIIKALENGKEELSNWLMTTDLPKWVREWLLPDDKIDEVCASKKLELVQEITKKMTEDKSLFQGVVEKVGKALEDALHERAKQAVILIK